MGVNNPQPQARIGGLYTEGPNPYPGGEVDTGGSLVPPYEGRSQGPNDTPSTRAATESVKRQMAQTVSAGADAENGQIASPGGEVAQGFGPVGADEVSHRVPEDPFGAGTSKGRRGETIKRRAGTESGRADLGTKGRSGRPFGSSDPREDSKNINPKGGS